MGAYDDSSDEESQQASLPKQPASQMDIMKQKNEILMEKLYHAEKKAGELKDAMESVGSGASSDLKDKKIVELAKKNRAMQVQVDALKTKAAAAANSALKFKQELQRQPPRDESDQIETNTKASSKPGTQTQQPFVNLEESKKARDLEKKVIKLRQDNQALSQQLDKAGRLLERETGEAVDIDNLAREDSNWKGRAQKIEILKSKIK